MRVNQKKRLRNIWYLMRRRCQNPQDSSYKHYGERGIGVCNEWESFRVFYKWAMKNGYNNSLCIDRINNEGDYSPSNCRWTNMKTNARNKRNNILITYQGQTKCIAEWADFFGMTYGQFYSRERWGRGLVYSIEDKDKCCSVENSEEYNQVLIDIRDELPFGSINKIAKTVGCSTATVRRVLKGKGYRPDVVNAAVQIFEFKKRMIYQIEEAVK